MPANGSPPLKLQFGLINHEGRYLTAETFGFKVQITLAKMLTDVLTVVVKRWLFPMGTFPGVTGERLSTQPQKEAKMDPGAGPSGLAGGLPAQPPGTVPGL